MGKAKAQPAKRIITSKGLILGLGLGIALASLFAYPWLGFLAGCAIGLVLGAAWK